MARLAVALPGRHVDLLALDAGGRHEGLEATMAKSSNNVNVDNHNNNNNDNHMNNNNLV